MTRIKASKTRVLMFGWEFPPYNSGGLGVACFGLARELSKKNVEIIFVLPKRFDINPDFLKVRFASDIKVTFREIDSALYEYITSDSYKQTILRLPGENYSGSLIQEVRRYALQAKEIAEGEEFELVHAHDWLTFPAGIVASSIKKVPLITHVHSTEFDRTGGNYLNQEVYNIEKEGVQKAKKVIAVSNLTKNILKDHYDVPDSKISVIHNGVDAGSTSKILFDLPTLKEKNSIVLFVGRLTLQKGCDYFLKAAKKVLEHNKNVIFVIAGSGDMEQILIEQSINLGISSNVIFTGFLRGHDLERIFQSADLFVMPSVSEPFGITSLESLINGTPIIISKQSGVSEVLEHALKVDFWDIDEIANKILATLTHKSLHKTLKDNGTEEVKKLTWEQAAGKTIKVYEELLDA